MPVTIKWNDGSDTRSLTFKATEIGRDMKGTKKLVPIPRSTHIAVPLGVEGPGIGIGFKVHSQAEYDLFETISMNTIVYIQTSDYPELRANTAWLVDKTNTKRTAGMCNTWICTLQLLRYYMSNFSVTPQSGRAPLQVSFVANGLGNNPICTWNFGDGSSGSGSSVTHTYSNVGAYNVTLTMRFLDGTSDVRTKNACVVVG